MRIANCAACGYPIATHASGENIECPMCKSINEVISQGVTIPTWLLAGGLGLLIGVIAGPAIIGSTEAGAKWLERKARERLS